MHKWFLFLNRKIISALFLAYKVQHRGVVFFHTAAYTIIKRRGGVQHSSNENAL